MENFAINIFFHQSTYEHKCTVSTSNLPIYVPRNAHSFSVKYDKLTYTVPTQTKRADHRRILTDGKIQRTMEQWSKICTPMEASNQTVHYTFFAWISQVWDLSQPPAPIVLFKPKESPLRNIPKPRDCLIVKLREFIKDEKTVQELAVEREIEFATQQYIASMRLDAEETAEKLDLLSVAMEEFNANQLAYEALEQTVAEVEKGNQALESLNATKREVYNMKQMRFRELTRVTITYFKEWHRLNVRQYNNLG